MLTTWISLWRPTTTGLYWLRRSVSFASTRSEQWSVGPVLVCLCYLIEMSVLATGSVIMFIVYYNLLLLPLILIIFSKPPSAELCKHTHGCQLSLESHQTVLGFPTTITSMVPLVVTPRITTRVLWIRINVEIWYLQHFGLKSAEQSGASSLSLSLSPASRNTYLQFL